MKTKIIRSSKRKKTIQAKVLKDTLVVFLPAGLSSGEEEKYVLQMAKKIDNKKLRKQLNGTNCYLKKQFSLFNKKYFDEKLEVNKLEFVTNQNKIVGSCTPANKTIRISHILADMPKWVLDYVIMHEMAHLAHPNHSKAFWKKVNEYKYTERARGYLIAKGMEDIN